MSGDTSTTSKVFSAEELAKLNTKESLHLVVSGKVYAIAPFVDEHPGGDEVLISEAGKDATDAFEDVGHSDEAREIMAKYLVGTADDAFAGPSAGKAGARLDQRASTNPIKGADRGNADSLTYILPLTLLVAYLAYRYYTKA